MVFKSTPACRLVDANVWRKSWKRTCGSCACLISLANSLENVGGSHAEPSRYRAAHDNAYPTVAEFFSRFTTWRAFAAIIAYCIWSFAVQPDASKLIACRFYPSCLTNIEAYAALAILVVSPVLASLDQLFKT